MNPLTHLDDAGAARMVDVGGKPITSREAVARGRILMSDSALSAIREGSTKKGDVIAVARIAGIMGAKRTAELIPLCHPLPLSRVEVALTLDTDGITVTATAATQGQTGVEMEALTAVNVTLLTIYDMAKAIDKHMRINDIHLVSKSGGRSGDWHVDRR